MEDEDEFKPVISVVWDTSSPTQLGRLNHPFDAIVACLAYSLWLGLQVVATTSEPGRGNRFASGGKHREGA